MNTATAKKEYTKRYTRPENPPNFELTDRAIHINAEICRRSLIRKDQLHALFPDMRPVPFGRVVRNLFSNGFIARPKQQQELHKDVLGSLPTYLTPDRRGVQLHTAVFKDPVPAAKYTQDNDRMTWSYMRHQHTTATTLLNYQAGAQAVPGLTFMTEPDLWIKYAPDKMLNRPALTLNDYPHLMAHDFIAKPPELQRGKAPAVPLELSATIEWAVHIPGQSGLNTIPIPVKTQPDGYFAHQATDTKFFFLESDEGTETIVPSKAIRQSQKLFYNTSLFAKYLVYIAAFRKRSHRKQFGIPSFSVITVTTTPRRVEQIVEKLQKELPRELTQKIPSDFLLFTDRQTLARFGNNPYHPDFRYKNLGA